MRATLGADELDGLRSGLERAYPRYLDELGRLVAIDSGSYQKAGVDAVAEWMMAQLAGLGASVRRHPNEDLGDTFVATFEGDTDGPAVLLVGHADTVFEPGTAARRPFRVADHRALGPGVCDMKGGLLMGLHAIEALCALGSTPGRWLPVGRLVYVINPDEEIGSPTSGAIVAELAHEAHAALVLEAARPNGAIVTSRAGMTHLRIQVDGRAAHAGVEPEKGRSAVLEAAHKTVALHDLNGRWNGVHVNVGRLVGGTRPNIVPDEASLIVDLRARERSAQSAAKLEIEAIARSSTVADTSSAVEVLAHHWPMERSVAASHLLAMATDLAAQLGFELHETASGGASDANTTAALGVPTLDGLGPIGGNAHSPDEYLQLDSVVPRATLLAALLVAIGRDPGLWPRP